MVDLSMANWQCHNQRVSRIFKVNPQPWMVSLTEPPLPLPLLFLDLHWPETPLAPRAKALAETQRLHLPGRFTAWWFIPLSKWGITPVINGISRVNPLIAGVITHLLSGMNHQVVPCWVTNPMHPGNFHGRRNQLLNLTLIKKPEKPSVDRPSRWNARPVGINIPMISHINEYIYIIIYICFIDLHCMLLWYSFGPCATFWYFRERLCRNIVFICSSLFAQTHSYFQSPQREHSHSN